MDLELHQKDLAAILGVSTGSVLHWERGAYKPAVRYWPGIIDFLGGDPSPPPRSVAEGLKAARRRLGYSQKGLARRLNVDTASVRDWERGRTNRFYRCPNRVADLFDELSIDVR